MPNEEEVTAEQTPEQVEEATQDEAPKPKTRASKSKETKPKDEAPKPKAKASKPKESKPQEEAPKPEYKGFVNVISSNGIVVRTYTLEDHGEDYAELAQQFASKKGYEVK